jgi:predicted Na+-dependent transporter
MKLNSLTDPFVFLTTSFTALLAFICSYFFNLYMNNSDQYLAVIGVMFLDGIFGIIAGTKREGFKTHKALSILKNTFVWLLILTAVLMIEKGFMGTSWLSEVIIVPFMVFQLISAMKNASLSGYIKSGLLNEILEKIDRHKHVDENEVK